MEAKPRTRKRRRKGRAKAGTVVTYSRKKPQHLVETDLFSSATTVRFPMDSTDGSSGTSCATAMPSTVEMSRSKARKVKTPRSRRSGAAFDMNSPPSVERGRDASCISHHHESFLTEDLPKPLRSMTGIIQDSSRSLSKSSFRKRENRAASTSPGSRGRRASPGALSTLRSIQSMDLTDPAGATPCVRSDSASEDSDDRTPSVLTKFQATPKRKSLMRSLPSVTSAIFNSGDTDSSSSSPPVVEHLDISVPSPAVELHVYSTSAAREEDHSISRSGLTYLPSQHDPGKSHHLSPATTADAPSLLAAQNTAPVLCSSCHASFVSEQLLSSQNNGGSEQQDAAVLPTQSIHSSSLQNNDTPNQQEVAATEHFSQEPLMCSTRISSRNAQQRASPPPQQHTSPNISIIMQNNYAPGQQEEEAMGHFSLEPLMCSTRIPSRSTSQTASSPSQHTSPNSTLAQNKGTSVQQEAAAMKHFGREPLMCSTRIPSRSTCQTASSPGQHTSPNSTLAQNKGTSVQQEAAAMKHFGREPLMCSTRISSRNTRRRASPDASIGDSTTQQLLVGSFRREPLMCSTRIASPATSTGGHISSIHHCEPFEPAVSKYDSQSPQSSPSMSSTLKNTEASGDLSVPDSDSWQEAPSSPSDGERALPPLRKCAVPEVDYTPCPMLALFAKMEPICTIAKKRASNKQPLVEKHPTDWIQAAPMSGK